VAADVVVNALWNGSPRPSPASTRSNSSFAKYPIGAEVDAFGMQAHRRL
jgi:hypothetical protein